MHTRRTLLYRVCCIKLQASGSDTSTPLGTSSEVGAPADKTPAVGKQTLREAVERLGFANRKDFDSHAWMSQNFAQAETLPSGIKVYNLPPAKPAEGETAFDLYRKTTNDYLSTANESGIAGVGLGAGFGSRPDKRLSWLRPRQQDHLTPLPPEAEESRLLQKIQEEGNQNIPEAKTPEERKKQIERMLKHMKSFDGMSMSRNEHFLLADLDFEKDALLFGHTRDDFIQNVDRLKSVILQYNRWERTDNAYYYATLFCKISCVWLIIDSIQTYVRFKMLRDSLDEFSELTHEEIAALKRNRDADFAKVQQELDMNPPDFTPVIQTILTERRKILDEERTRRDVDEREAKHTAAAVAAASGGATIFVEGGNSSSGDGVAVVHITEEEKRKAHPMDTTFEAAAKQRDEDERRRKDMQRFAAASDGNSDTSAKGGRSSWSFLTSWWWNKKPLLAKSNNNQKATLSDAEKRELLDRPLSAADFVTFSYAAAPTSIATVRSIRRILLPRADDFTQIVREEMAEYKQKKDSSAGY